MIEDTTGEPPDSGIGAFADSSFVMTDDARQAWDFLQRSTLESRFLALALVGPAGAGKTSLLRFLVAKASDSGAEAVEVDAQGFRSLEDVIANIGLTISRKFRLLDKWSDRSSPQNLGVSFLDLIERRVTNPVERLITILETVDRNGERKTPFILALDGLENGLVNSRGFLNFLLRLDELELQRFKLVFTTKEASPSIQYKAKALKELHLQPLNLEEIQRLLLGQGADYTFDIRNRVDEAISRVVDRHEEPGQLSRLLHQAALFGADDIAFYHELTGVSDAAFDGMIQHLGRLVSITGSGDKEDRQIDLHPLAASVLRDMLLALFRTSIPELHFGAEEAERDQQLSDLVVPSPWLRPLLAGKDGIVIGDRGSGKSAIFRLLTEPASAGPGPVRGTSVVLADNNPAAFVQRLTTRDSHAASADQFKAIWLSFVAALVAQYLERPGSAVPWRPGLLRDARSILKASGTPRLKNGQAKRVGRIARMLGPLFRTKLSLKLGPITIEPQSGTVGGWLAGGEIDVDDFLVSAEAELNRAGTSLRIVVDRIDEIYKYKRDHQEPLIQGLFLAEARISLLRSIGLLVLIRTDLFERYDIQEKNKFQSRTVMLDWDEDDIVAVLLRRVFSNVALRQLAEHLGIKPEKPGVHQEAALRLIFPEEIEGRPIRDWLADYLPNGRGRIAPRQIVLFLNGAREEMLRAGEQTGSVPVFNRSVISSAMSRLSELSYDEVISDFRIGTSFVRNCRAGRVSRFRPEEIGKLMDPDEGSVGEQLEMLERLGFLQRQIIRDPHGILQTTFVIPSLYTRCWSLQPH